MFGIEPLQLGKQDLIIRLLVDIVNIDILDDTCFVDDENGAFGAPIGTQYTILLGDLAMRPEIAQKWIGNPTQAFSPGLQTRNRINAYAQDLDIQSRKSVVLGLIRRDLRRSDRRPG